MTLRVELDRRTALATVRDQGPYQTCLSHAISSVHENRRASRAPLSAEHLHHHSAGPFTKAAAVTTTQSVLATVGQPLMGDCEPPSPTWKPTPGVTNYKRASTQAAPSTRSVQTSLRAGNFPVLIVTISTAFVRAQPPWVLQHGDGQVVGVHAVVAVGCGKHYGKDAILIRNSWGTGWADGGHLWLSQPFLDHHLKQVIELGSELP